jgi:hypothetical protein
MESDYHYHRFPPVSGLKTEIYGKKSEYGYDARGNETSFISYKYDPTAKTYVLQEKYEYTFGDVFIEGLLDDDGDNLLTVKQSRWENGAWVVKMDVKCEWAFDTANNPLSVTVSQKEGDQWIWGGTITWYYSQRKATGIETLSPNGLQVWISGDELKIARYEGSKHVQIFDMSGRLMVSGQWSDRNSIRIAHLPKAVYIVKTGGITAKFIKR